MRRENADAAELARFERIAARWWDPQGEFRPLHALNPLRVDYIAERADLNGTRVLDVGCGGGLLCEGLAARGAKVTGIDLGEEALEVARLHQLESGAQVDYRRGSAESFAETNETPFDVVTCLELLEHVPDPGSVINACAALVRPGGTVFFSTINRNPKSFLMAIVGAEYLLNLVPKGTHEYAKLIKPAELSRWIRASHLHLEELTGVHYNPITERFFMGGNVDVNYFAVCKKPNMQ